MMWLCAMAFLYESIMQHNSVRRNCLCLLIYFFNQVHHHSLTSLCWPSDCGGGGGGHDRPETVTDHVTCGGVDILSFV